MMNLLTSLIYIPAAVPAKAEELTYNKYFPNAAIVVSDANAAVNLNWNNPLKALTSELSDSARLSDFTESNSAYLSFGQNNLNSGSTTPVDSSLATTQATTTEPAASSENASLPGDNVGQSTSTDSIATGTPQTVIAQDSDIEMASTTQDQNLDGSATSSDDSQDQNIGPDQSASSTTGTSSPDSNIDNTDSSTASDNSFSAPTTPPLENFVSSPHLEYSGFTLGSSDPDIASSTVPQILNLRLSLAGISNPGSSLVLEFATASSSWQSLGSITFDSEQSNSTNGGYYSFQLPVGLFQSVSDLKIRLSYKTQSGVMPASSDFLYLDGIWLEAGYPKTQIEDDDYWANFTLASSTPESFIHLDFINNLLQTNLPGDLSSPITVGSKQSFAGQPFEMLLVGVNASSTGQRVDGKVIYQNAFSSTDLEYHLNGKGLKENIILKNKNHPAKFRYVLNLDNYDYVQNSPSLITLYKKGKQGNPLYKLYSISAPVMTDSSGNTSNKLVFKLKKNLLTLIPDATWLNTASYPVTIDPTVEINILNVVSYPVAGDYWTIDFVTVGQEDLSVTPADQASINDMQFTSLTCDGNAMPATVGDRNVVSSAGWTCGGIGEVKFLDLKTGHHQMIFNFGGVVQDAYNGANVWTGGVDNNWETNGNWSMGLAPVAGNDVVINSAVTVNINGPTAINSLTLGDSGGGVASILNFNYDAITVNPLTISGDLNVYSGATITHTTGTSSVVGKINMSVGGDANIAGSINADGKGYQISQGPGAGPITADGDKNGAGGSYGGLGGYYAADSAPAASLIYGSLTAPTDLGSGGGFACGGYSGGTGYNGGGAIELKVTGTATISGSISAKGSSSGSGCWNPGGGSGGSVYLTATTLSGAGIISANGGSPGGSGGRVAVYYTTDNSSISYQSYGDANGSIELAGAGTIYKENPSHQTNGDLILDNNILGSPSAGFGRTVLSTSTAYTFDNLTITHSADLDIIPGTNLTAATTTWATGIITDSDGSFNLLAQHQDLTIPATAILIFNVQGATRIYRNIIVNGTLTQTANNNAVTATPADLLYKLNWTITGNLTVNTGGSINADGKGYKVGQGPGTGPTTSGQYGSGGSYGGLGGYYDSSAIPGDSLVYGSLAMPTDLGSGAGYTCGWTSGGSGENGGGSVQLTVNGTTTIASGGIISANGSNGDGNNCWNNGGGSGGSVYLNTATLSGSGAIQANGGNGRFPAGGGGGGRIAVIAETNNSTINRTVVGGSVLYQAGSLGTLYPSDYPSVSTQAVTNNVTGTTVTGNGTITSLGFYPITQYGHVWATTTNPYLPDTNMAVPATGGTPGASDQDEGAAANAFDNNASTFWRTDQNVPSYLEYDYPVPSVVNKYVLVSEPENFPQESPRDWQFQAWDGSSWGTLQTISNQTGWVNSETRSFTLVNTTPYSKYRLYITAHSDWWNTVALAEFKMMDTTTFSDTNGATAILGPYTSSVTGLAINTTYHIRSYVTNFAGTAYGEDQTFSTGAANGVPFSPSSLGPNDFVTGTVWVASTTPTFTFYLNDPDPGDQVKYRIILDSNSNYSSPLIDYTSALQATGTASFTVGQNAGSGSYLIGHSGQTLPDNSTYYWEVQAIDNHGATSAFSQADSGGIAFKEDATAPNPGSMTFTPFSDSISVYTTGSSDNLSGVASFTYTNLTTAQSNGPTASTLWANSGLTPNTQYTYEIAVTDTAGNSSTTPTFSKYTLAAVPTALQATSTSTSTVALAWNANGNPAGTQYFAENLTGAHNSGWITSTSTILTGLSCNTSYSFDVVAKNAEGIVTASSTPVSPPASPCNSNPNAPTNLGSGYYTGGYWVNNNAPAVSFNLTDPDVSDTVKYEIQFSTTSNFSNLLVDYTSALQSQGGASFTVGQATSTGSYASGFTGQTLSDNSNGYYWRVKAFDNTGAASAYTAANSGAVAFLLDTVPPSAGVLSLVDATGTTVTLSYSGSTDNASGLVNPYNFINTDNWDSSGNTSATEWTDTLTVSGTYHYKIRITDVAGNYTDVFLPGSVTVTVPSSPPPPPDPWGNPPPNGPNGFMLLINQGDTLTSTRNVTLQLTGPDGAGIANMIVSNHSDLSGGTLESYQTTKSWDICAGLGGCSNGIYTVYGQFYSSTGSSSPIVSDQIRLQVISSLIPGNLTLGSITNNSITSTISGASDNSVGLAASPYIFYNSTEGTNSAATSSTAWQSLSLQPNTQYTFYASVTNQHSDMVVTPSVSAYTLANAPNNLEATGSQSTALTTSWSANNNPNGTDYDVTNITTGADSGWTTATSSTFSNLTCETSYTFVVKAMNGNGVQTASSSQANGLTGSCNHTITAFADANGSISPSGAVVVSNGSDQTFTLTPNSGYQVSDVLVDGSSVGAVTSYTFSNVSADHTIEAAFAVSAPPGGGGGGTPVNPPTPLPGNLSIIINNNDAATNNPQVSLALNGGSEAKSMAISNFSDFSGAIIEPYVTAKSWNLCPPSGSCNFGTYTVYAKFYFASGSASQAVSDSIDLAAEPSPPPPKPKPPVIVLQGSTDQKNWTVTLPDVEIGQEVSLRASILSSSSISGGTKTYQFDCSADGQDGGLNVQSDLTFYTALNLCSYPKAGTYTARVLVTINSYTITGTMKIVVRTPTPLPQTHLACQNQACVAVPGQGADLCETNEDCLPATHLACRQFACTAIQGAGKDECYRDSDCQGIIIGNPPKTPVVIPPANPPAPIGGNPPSPTNPIIGDIIGAANGVAASLADLGGLTIDLARKAAAKLAKGKTSTQLSAGIDVVAIAPTAVAAQYSLVSQGLVINISSFYEFWLYLLSLFYALLTALGIRAKRRHWGTVYDSENKQPLDPAIVELVDFETGKVAEQSITDLNGRFGFLDKPGKYLIHSKKTHYQFPSRKIFGAKDGAFENLYHGELFVIGQSGSVISPNIPMDPLEFDWNQQDKQRLVMFHPRLEKALNAVLSVLFWGGAAGVFLLFCVNTNFINGLFCLLYVFLAILRHLLLRVRLWGRLESNRTNVAGLYLELSPASLPKIIIGKSMANQSGKFFLKAKPGRYILRVKEIGAPMGDTLTTKLLYEREIRVGKDGVVNGDFKI